MNNIFNLGILNSRQNQRIVELSLPNRVNYLSLRFIKR